MCVFFFNPGLLNSFCFNEFVSRILGFSRVLGGLI